MSADCSGLWWTVMVGCDGGLCWWTVTVMEDCCYTPVTVIVPHCPLPLPLLQPALPQQGRRLLLQSRDRGQAGGGALLRVAEQDAGAAGVTDPAERH